jgi:hypothetical protein
MARRRFSVLVLVCVMVYGRILWTWKGRYKEGLLRTSLSTDTRGIKWIIEKTQI